MQKDSFHKQGNNLTETNKNQKAMDKELLRPYDAIRPFEPDELPEVFDRLLSNEQFRQVLAYVLPGKPLTEVEQLMRSCSSCLDFQYKFSYGFLVQLLAKASLGCDMDASAIDTEQRYTFVSNHRDIVLDSALLDKLLVDCGFKTTCEIAIGDNLLSLPWVKDLVRLNKSFIVERGLPLRQMLVASRRLSEYMHIVINQKHDNVWIAQREGRAKDSNDRTQESVLKMMAIGGEGSVQQRLADLHIVPLAISYEFDPCDVLKAQELQCRRDVAGWKKGPMDDVISMQTGIMGYKGHIHYQCAPCIDEWLMQLDAAIPKTEIFGVVARHIDEAIHKGYKLFANNYVALDLLNGNEEHADHYTAEEKSVFLKYLDGQLGKVTLENPDIPFLRESMLTMYANPAKNQLAALSK